MDLSYVSYAGSIFGVFSLLIAFQIKHFLCDFPFQTVYMLGKFKKDNWIEPLFLHAFVHCIGTFLIIFMFLILSDNLSHYWLLSLSILDLVLHFWIDRIKASPNYFGNLKPDNKYFWWTLGVDQTLHHLTHYLIIFIVLISIM